MLRTYVPARKFERIRKLPRKPNFAHYLRDARIKRHLSVAEVAEQVGVSTASVYFWENDHVTTTGCKFERTLQGVETADQGDAGDGGRIVSVLPFKMRGPVLLGRVPGTVATICRSHLLRTRGRTRDNAAHRRIGHDRCQDCRLVE